MLIVAVDSDANVRRLKGEGRPIFSQHDRMSLLTALRVVDAVVLLECSELLGSLLRRLRPHVYVKGSDYVGKPVGITALLQELGIAYEIDPVDVGSHTSAIIAHICQRCASCETAPPQHLLGRCETGKCERALYYQKCFS